MSASVARSNAARRPSRARSALSVALAVLAAAAVVVGGICVYVRQELLDSKSFADRTVATLGDEPVRRVIAREVVVQVVDKGSPDLLAARPLLNSVVEAVAETPQFRSLARLAAEQGHRLLFDRGGNVAFSIADAGTVVLSALRTLAPGIADKIPQKVDAKLLDLRKQSFAVRTLRIADKVRLLGLVLPFLALVLLAGSIAVAPRRRVAVTRCAVALAVASLAAFVDLQLARHSVISNLYGSAELTDADVREAASVLWEGYVGDLSRWAFGVALAAAIVAAASASVLRPYTAGSGLRRLRERVVHPRTPRGLVVRAVVALVFGTAMLADPLFALDVVTIVAGVLLSYFGVGELLSAAGAAPEGRFSLRRSRNGAAAAVASLAVLIAGAAVALASGNTDATAPVAKAGEASTCNGYAQLCSKRIDEVVFPGTHNAMSAADSPGWFIANQSHGIARQLDDGMRAFKISTHYGEGRPGDVRTDIASSGEKVNRVSEKLTEEARHALQRFSGAVGFGKAKGKREVWLCHTLCELGATNAATFFSTVVRFLRQNPGTVLIFFDEDYVSEDELEALFKRTGLYSHLAVLRAGQQLPTLGQLVRSQHNVLIFTQEPVSGSKPWNMYGFGGFIQDTPLGAVKPSEFSCKLNRGTPSSPLLMMNDWADVFPPRRSPNVPLTQRAFIVKRARQCEAERHHIPNLILTDFYDTGDVVGAARVLNGLGDAKPAPIAPLERR